MAEKNKNLVTRPPVVVVMGHVDSGKTSILDVIRKTHVADKESGGITQHIGAYQIEKDGKKITFLDTPGHEAFSQMRSRGANVADIAILVVDTTKGVEDQTKEAIGHAKKAGIHLIVALNKVDRPEANMEKAKGELAKEDVLVESMGGKIPSVETSVKTGKGIEEILDLILLVAEMDDLKADISKPAEGTVIESYMDCQRGIISTLILSNGVLRPGDIIGTLSAFGKIKGLEDFKEKQVSSAFPSDPVIVLGFEGVPKTGEIFKSFTDIESAKNDVSLLKKENEKALGLGPDQKALNLILKTDVLGSSEAIEGILKELPQDKIVLRILKSEVGDISESDLKLARSCRALILGFRVKVSPMIKNLAEKEKVKLMAFDIIYELVEGLRKFMERMLSPEQVRVDLGKVKILAVFLTDKNRQIIGGKVIEGEIKKGTSIEVFRQEEFLGKGRMINLQKNKKEAERVQRGDECGMLYEGEVKVEQGDILNFYQEEMRKIEL